MNNRIYRTIIADDEAPARDRIRKLITQFPDVLVIDEACDGLETLSKVNTLKPDLLFLDIQMPGLNGFEVIKQLRYVPLIVFCSAFDEYALKAFETNAIDYIVKPIKEERIQHSLSKLRNLTIEPNKAQILHVLEEYLNIKQKKQITSIPVKIGDRMLLIKLSEISYFISEEKYVSIVKKDGKRFITDHSLKLLKEKLPDHFIRIHRSLLVNSQMIDEINKHFGSRFVIRMNDSERSRLISGRNFYDEIKALVEF